MKIYYFVGLFVLITLSLACGRGGEVLTDQKLFKLRAKVDFSELETNGSAKSVSRLNEKKFVIVRNIRTGEVVVEIELDDDGFFSVEIPQGEYEIIAKFQNKTLKLIKSLKEDSTNEDVNLKSTTLAVYISSLVEEDLSELTEEEIESNLKEADKILTQAVETLTTPDAGAAAKNAALVILSIQEKTRKSDGDLLENPQIIKKEITEIDKLSEEFKEVTKKIIIETKKSVTLANGLQFDSVTELEANTRVLDNMQISVITVTHFAKRINGPPICDAGPSVESGLGTIVLNGSANDPDNDPVQFQWIQISGPAIQIINATSAQASFEALQEGSYTFELKVSSEGGADQDQVTILIKSNIQNIPPIANAGFSQIVRPGQKVILDGSSSSDPNQLPLSFIWSSNDSSIEVFNDILPKAYFIAPNKDAIVDFNLTVSNNTTSDTDIVQIVIRVLKNIAQFASEHYEILKNNLETLQKSSSFSVNGLSDSTQHSSSSFKLTSD